MDENNSGKRKWINAAVICAASGALVWYGISSKSFERVPDYANRAKTAIVDVFTTDVAESGQKYMAKLEKEKDLHEHEQNTAEVASAALYKISPEKAKSIALEYLVKNPQYISSEEGFRAVNAFAPALADSSNAIISLLKPNLSDEQRKELSIAVYNDIEQTGTKLDVLRYMDRREWPVAFKYLGEKSKAAGQNIKEWIKKQ